MITTRQISVNLSKEKLKFRQVTTKGIDASIRVEPPKGKIKPRGVSTTTLSDVADIMEKKRRDDIMAEKKLAAKDAKKIAMAAKKVKKEEELKQKEKVVEIVDTITHPVAKSIEEPITTSKEQEIEVERKPWNKMNAEERKEYQREKREAKKKEELK